MSPYITAGNKAIVHHTVVSLCDGLEGHDLGESGSNCEHISHRVKRCLTSIIGAWAVGGAVSYLML